MFESHSELRVAALAGWLLLFAGVATAETPIPYIATTGNDANSCGVKSPCRSLQRGINATPANGVLQVVNSGVYGRGTITKSMTVAGGGATLVGDIRINGADAVVALRDLTLSGAGRRGMGVYVLAASAVHLDSCTIERFKEHGFVSGDSDVELFVADTTIRDNGGPGITVFILNAPPNATGTMTLTVDDTRVENNGGDGFLLTHGVRATISRTMSSGNHAHGFDVSLSSATIVSATASQNGFTGFLFYLSKVSLESSVASANGDIGLNGLGEGPVTISNSAFTNNGSTGIMTDDDVVYTRGNNTVSDNPTDVDGTLTPLTGQ